MRKLILLSTILFFCLPAISGKATEPMVFSYQRPYNFELINDAYKVQAMINSTDWGKGVEVSFNGELLPVKSLESGELQIWLPLTGNPGFLEFTKGKKKEVVGKQYFEPLIPADWDYFGKGKVHVIVSSHQDI